MSKGSPGVVGRVTLADVAAVAGVDRSVVSRVVSGDADLHVRPETRERVLAAVRDLGYRPNAIARSLRTAQSGALGLIIPNFSNPVYSEIIAGAEVAAAAHNSRLLIGSWYPGAAEQSWHLDLVASGRVDGVLLAGAHVDDDLLQQLDHSAVPLLLVNRRTRSARRSIVLDDEGAARLAVQHLVDLGHERIGHVAGPRSADTARRRRDGYLRVLKGSGIEADPTLVVEADYTSAGGAAGMAELLQLRTPPTAVFVSNALAAVGALHVAAELGFRIPDDISVVAVHDLALTAFLRPPLTTVRMPLQDLGRRAVEILCTTRQDEPVKECLREPMELLERASTAPPPPSGRRR